MKYDEKEVLILEYGTTKELFVSKNIYKNSHAMPKAFLLSLLVHLLLLGLYFFYTYSEKKEIITFAPATKPLQVSLALWEPKTAAKPTPKLPEPKKEMKQIKQKPAKQKVVQKKLTPPKRQEQVKTQNAAPVQTQPQTQHQMQTKPQTQPQTQSQKQAKTQTQPNAAEATKTVKTKSQTPPNAAALAAQKPAITPDMLSQIRALIQASLRYPPMAKRLGIEGVTVVTFVLTHEGEVKSANVVSSSGNHSLDSSAIKSVLSLSGEYPHPEKSVDLRIPIAFEIKNS